MIVKFLILGLLLIGSSFTMAQVSVTEIRVNAPVPGQSISGGYMLIRNEGNQDVRLLAVKSASATRVEMHTHVMNNGMMGMQEIQAVNIPAGETVSFVEGGHHLMIFDPATEAIAVGEFSLTFEFSDGSALSESAVVTQLVKPEHQH